MVQDTAKGYAVTDPKNWSNLTLVDYPLKNFKETDIVIDISHCGVCGSDLHTASGGWGPLVQTPMVVGHEIVGKVTRVGSQVKGFKVGDRAGIGAQVGSCYDCRACKSDNEQYCPSMVDTYNAKYDDGVVTMGGYSNRIIAHEKFVFPIPEQLSSAEACSMLCGGLTVYSPLKRNGCGPGKKFGIVGLGGLGHYAVLFAKALGAEVFVFSHSNSKEEDAKKMGADHFIVSSKKDFAKPYFHALDGIICTSSSAEEPLADYLSMLWVGGSLVHVGMPETPFAELKAPDIAMNAARLAGSHIGSKVEAVEMLKLAASKGIKPWIQEMPMCKAGEALSNVKNSKVRYRQVLTMDIE